MTDNGSLKRDASDDEMEECEGPTKRARSSGHDIDTRFLIQSKNAGAIIGKGGSNIKRLRTEFKASVTVPDCNGPERILSITTDVYTLGEILQDVVPKLNDVSQHGSKESECELRMLVHQSHAGCLIGRGGSRIKELREKTGAQIKIFSNCCPSSTERVVQIIGSPGVIVDCVKEICTITSQTPTKGPNRLYDPYNCGPPVFSGEYGGYEDTLQKGRNRGSMRGGRMAPPAWKDDIVDNFSFGRSDRGQGGLMDQSRWNHMGDVGASAGGGGILGRPGWNDDIDSYGSYGSASRNRGLGGNAPALMGQGMSSLGGPRTLLQGYSGSTGAGLNGPPPHMMSSRQGGYVASIPGTGELFSAKPASNAMGSASIKMKIPNDVAGAIIGKGGQRIRKIRYDSAATINIEEAASGTNDRIITITGTMKQVSMAQYLMQQSVRDNQGRRF